MNERDRLAFSRFVVIWDGNESEIPDGFILSKWKYCVDSEHNDPHDAPMTCMRCVVDECYELADRLLSLTKQ